MGEQDESGKETAATNAEELSNVMYIGHLPHGFYEEELAGYFSQFGTLTRLRLSRNPKTGRSRGYAFIEFKYPEVARIASQTMDGYFMFGNKLVCSIMKQQDVHKRMFSHWRRKLNGHTKANARKRREAHNRPRSEEEHAARVKKLKENDQKRQGRILELGIDYEYTGFKDVAVRTVKKMHPDSQRELSCRDVGAPSTTDEYLDISDVEDSSDSGSEAAVVDDSDRAGLPTAGNAPHTDKGLEHTAIHEPQAVTVMQAESVGQPQNDSSKQKKHRQGDILVPTSKKKTPKKGKRGRNPAC